MSQERLLMHHSGVVLPTPPSPEDLSDFQTKTEKFHSQAPRDIGSAAYWIFVLLGVGLLFGWNSFISDPDYFKENYLENIEFLISIAYTVPNVSGLLLMIRFGKKLSFVVTIFGSFFVCGFVLLLVPFVLDWGVGHGGGAAIILTFVFLNGIGTAILQASLFGFAAKMPPVYSQALMGGNGIAGVIVAVIRIVTYAAMPSDTEKSSMIYFMCSGGVVFLCILCFFILLRMPFTRYYITQNPADSVYELGNADELTDDDELYSDCGEEAHGQGDHNIRRLDSVTGLSVNEGTSLVPAESRKSDRAAEKSGYGTTERVPSAEMDLEELHRGSQSRSRSTSVWSIIKQRWIVVFGVFYTFFVSLTVFPGIATSIEPTDKLVSPQWFGIIIVAIFNVFDTIGRLAPGRFQFFSERVILIPILCRTIFILLFLFCVKPQLLGSTWWSFCFMAVMALTNGYFGSLCMMYGPRGVKSYDKEKTGTIMTASLLMGITAGSFFGLGIGLTF